MDSAQPAASPAGGAARKQPETLLEFAAAGGPLMVPIAACSIAWVAFLVERLIQLRRRRAAPPELFRAIRDLCAARPVDRTKARAAIDSQPSAAATVLRAALERLDLGREEIERGVNNTAQREIFEMRRNVRVFAIVSSVAPLLGLLGTVTGLVQAFREVAISGLGSAGSALAPGIYEALITTVGGLFVAIPSLLTYYWFMARVDHYVHEIDKLVEDFVDACLLPEPRAERGGVP
ncbi:MAG: MotA/TolQ/ExbB proton channel family protein [Planctomycetes bacterium]|nr:MotA/TolQ/ExbB proton channel family protein [Planctomycetota bacterium]